MKDFNPKESNMSDGFVTPGALLHIMDSTDSQNGTCIAPGVQGFGEPDFYLIVADRANETIFSIGRDGRVTLGPGFTTNDGASRVFFEAMNSFFEFRLNRDRHLREGAEAQAEHFLAQREAAATQLAAVSKEAEVLRRELIIARDEIKRLTPSWTGTP
jgi:hypothetical protein